VFIDRGLHLPKSWIEDRDRCRAAGVPDDVEFATQTVQARALVAGVPFTWVTADHMMGEVYGRDTDLRTWLEAQGVAQVLSCKSTQTVITAEATWRRAAELVAGLPGCRRGRGAAAAPAPVRTGCRVNASATGRGSPIRVAWESRRGHWLPARRSISSGELAFHTCFGPRGTSLADLARVTGSRWRVEECSQQAENEAGLDHCQVRDYRARYAHITLSMLTSAWLSATRATLARTGEEGGPGAVDTAAVRTSSPG
jgi:SRSO17 transposase